MQGGKITRGGKKPRFQLYLTYHFIKTIWLDLYIVSTTFIMLLEVCTHRRRIPFGHPAVFLMIIL